MNVRCVVAGNGGNGPDFVGVNVEATQEEIAGGDHYDKAKAEVRSLDAPYVVFDEYDGPGWLFAHVFGTKPCEIK